MKGCKALALLLLFAALPTAGHSYSLRFVTEIGRKYRIKNLITQDIYVNGTLFARQAGMNKATIEAVSLSNNYGLYEGEYSYYARNLTVDESFHLDGVYQTRFYRNELGEMLISPRFVMPTLRNIPVLPAYDVKIGDSWTGTGTEMHEGLMEGFAQMEFKVSVMYKLLDVVTNNAGESLAKISIDYNAMHYPPNDPNLFSFTGYSHVIYFFNMTAGEPYSYTDEFSFMATLKNGETIVYKGTSEAQVEYLFDVTNRQQLLANISNTVRNDEGVNVRQETDGILVNLGNILFDINRATLKPEALATLDKLAKILRDYPQLDIVVSGHTDITGNEQYNQVLSEQRAKAVSDYLLEQGIASHRISYVGYGSTRPLSSNDTTSGRAMNRRVEIKILTDE